MGLLSHDEILELHATAVSARLTGSRAALLAGLDPAFVAIIPQSQAPAEQVLVDLDALNRVEALTNDAIPLAVWLKNAVALTRARDEGAVFNRALEHLAARTKSGSPKSATTTAPPLRISFPTEAEPQTFWVPRQGRASFYRLYVSNSGQNIAQRCVGQLLSVKATNSPLVDLLGKPVTLKWAHEVDFRPISIGPGESRRLDLFYIFEGDTKIEFYIDIPSIPVGIQSKYPLRSYVVEVRVAAEDTSHHACPGMNVPEGLKRAGGELHGPA